MNKKGEPTQISGADLSRFVLHSALLRLIDPVRGEPTRYTLDENPDGSLLGSWQLTQKFLDSFALICATSGSGAKTASAVCLETHGQAGTILRVARNHGLTPEDLAGLKKVLKVLQEVAIKGTCFHQNAINSIDIVGDAERLSTQAESEILQLIVELDRGRILSLAKRIEKRGIRDFLQKTRSRLNDRQLKSGKFRLWLEKCPFLTSTSQDWNHETTVILIDWASQARWYHAEQLQTLLGPEKSQYQVWLYNLHKIARYYSAVKSMVKFAMKEPDIFKEISIQEITAPRPVLFKLPNEKTPLFTAVSKLMNKDTHSTMEQLEKHLSTQDVEAQLREACRLNLTLHAEMQLVVFYEGSPERAPRVRLIGTSKKACFLCNGYLRHHPLKLQVSACHQKIYPSWRPPPYYKVPGKFMNAPFNKLLDDIEKLTKRDLKTALDSPRRHMNYDSTAGPSLTLTATIPTELRSLQAAQRKLMIRDDGSSEDSD
ncbi:uncharacterized protein FTOL_05712 [Fusarium torulosum]|uniref:Uncharacterized protein n=1 Tax=Fusarium torulosum TaxID=33205 RepID=A0AAE8M7V4_9HYPO|nr:uncharacterized protein FTOL_05712 [Fusarium torulosum]